MSSATENTEAVILSRTIDPERGDLSPAAAESILQMKLKETDCKRVHELATRAADGALSEDEAQELERYRNVGRLLELMKSKARISLK